jgi:hypothetical protein
MVTEKRLVVPSIDIQEMVVTIAGRTPLICNKFSERELSAIEAKQTGQATGPREFRDPEQLFRDSLYVIDESACRYGFPASGVKAALVASGRIAGVQMTKLRGALNIVPVVGDLLEVKGSAPRMRRDRCRVEKTGNPIPAYRGEFDPWSIDVPVSFVSNVISAQQVLSLFQIAGFSVGIGQWRPENDGTFGQFAPVLDKGVELKEGKRK